MNIILNNEQAQVIRDALRERYGAHIYDVNTPEMISNLYRMLNPSVQPQELDYEVEYRSPDRIWYWLSDTDYVEVRVEYIATMAEWHKNNPPKKKDPYADIGLKDLAKQIKIIEQNNPAALDFGAWVLEHANDDGMGFRLTDMMRAYLNWANPAKES